MRSHPRIARIPVVVAVLAALALLLGACSKGPDLTRAKARAFELLGQYGPKVSGLIGKRAALEQRLAALPKDAAGTDEVGQTLAAAKATTEQLKAALDGYGARIERAGKSGEKGIEEAVTAFADELNGGIGKVSAGLDAAGKQLASIEAKAKAEAAAPPVVDVAIALPGGQSVTGAPGGVEQHLAALLADPAKQPGADDDPAAWLTLERVKFAPDQPAPGGPAGDDQVKAIAAILKAFPRAKLAVGGHAAAGEANADVLPKLRASEVMKALVAAGVAKARLSALGRGTDHPLCTVTGAAADETCNAQNRRVAVRVTAK